jgi:hypothetical protein
VAEWFDISMTGFRLFLLVLAALFGVFILGRVANTLSGGAFLWF